MAFLDSSILIVDAVLTDKGREKLASNSFNIEKFALGDDEIDYSLYDESNTNGPNFYGIAIENMPILESFTRADSALKYKLHTMPPSTTQVPQMGGTPETVSMFGDGASSPDFVVISPATLRFDEDEDYIFELQDDEFVDIIVGDYAEQVKNVAHTVIMEQITLDGEPVTKSSYQQILFGKNNERIPLGRQEKKLFKGAYVLKFPRDAKSNISIAAIKAEGEIRLVGANGLTQRITNDQVIYADRGVAINVEGAGIITLGLENSKTGKGNKGGASTVNNEAAMEGAIAEISKSNRAIITESERGTFSDIGLAKNSQITVSYRSKAGGEQQINAFVKAINAQKTRITLTRALSTAIPASVVIMNASSKAAAEEEKEQDIVFDDVIDTKSPFSKDVIKGEKGTDGKGAKDSKKEDDISFDSPAKGRDVELEK
tara:strand:- start:695 stop:1984 length:1290 start_codon:yes stop_codon:yes gene_type:complete